MYIHHPSIKCRNTEAKDGIDGDNDNGGCFEPQASLITSQLPFCMHSIPLRTGPPNQMLLPLTAKGEAVCAALSAEQKLLGAWAHWLQHIPPARLVSEREVEGVASCPRPSQQLPPGFPGPPVTPSVPLLAAMALDNILVDYPEAAVQVRGRLIVVGEGARRGEGGRGHKLSCPAVALSLNRPAMDARKLCTVYLQAQMIELFSFSGVCSAQQHLKFPACGFFLT